MNKDHKTDLMTTTGPALARSSYPTTLAARLGGRRGLLIGLAAFSVILFLVGAFVSSTSSPVG